jgi:NADH dehydrogenase
MTHKKTADQGTTKHVVIVGAGFAGIGCAKELARHDGIRVTLIDRHNYQQFTPLLYQLATAQLGSSDIAMNNRQEFLHHPSVDVKLANVTAIDPASRTVTTDAGDEYVGDYLVLAAGGRPNYFNTVGTENAWPLYSLEDAERLRSRILALFESADDDPSLIDKGALNFVVVGGGATGTEISGALAELIHGVMPSEYHGLAVERARVILVDAGHEILAQFSSSAHEYAAKALRRDGVELRLGTTISEISDRQVVLADGSSILTHCVIWAGGLQASGLAVAAGLPVGRGGRVTVQPDLQVPGLDACYAVGDVANIAAADGSVLPQLGSVAQQSGRWAGRNIAADVAGKPQTSFHYHDKGIMAMIGKNAAVAEVGPHRHELHGAVAFSAWLGVHVVLLSGLRHRVDAFVGWAYDYFTNSRAPQVLDRTDVAHINWDSDESGSGGSDA